MAEKPNETFVGIVSEERSIDYMHNSLHTLKIGFVISADGSKEDQRKAIDDFADAVDEFVKNYNENNNK